MTHIHVRNVHKRLQKKDGLETHMHNNHQPINCKFCSVSVKGLNELKNHVKQQHGTYTCEECAQAFTKKR